MVEACTLTLPLPWKWDRKPSWERRPPCAQKSRASLSPKRRQWQCAGLAKVPQLTTLTSFSWTYHIPPRPPALHQTNHRNTQGSQFLQVFISLGRLLCHGHLYENTMHLCCVLLFCWAGLISLFSVQPGTQGSRKTLSSPTHFTLIILLFVLRGSGNRKVFPTEGLGEGGKPKVSLKGRKWPWCFKRSGRSGAGGEKWEIRAEACEEIKQLPTS